MVDQLRPDKINAVVLLTDGVNDDGDPSDDAEQFDELIAVAAVRQRGVSVAAGAAVHDLLRRGRRRGHAAGDRPGHQRRHYDASNPATIDQVFTAVISNF